MSENIKGALLGLDVENDNHWTVDGLPRLDTVRMLAGNPGITQEEVEASVPGFNRSNAHTLGQPDEVAPESSPEVAAPLEPFVPEVTADDLPKADAPVEEEPDTTTEVEVEAEVEVSLDLEEAKQALAEQIDKVSELREARNEADRLFNAARAVEDQLRINVEKLTPKQESVNAIQSYLKGQRQSLEKRAERKRMIKESGIDLKELASGLRSPLDAAMSRKTSRGTGRPGS